MTGKRRLILAICLAIVSWAWFDWMLPNPTSADSPMLALQADDPNIPANSDFDLTVVVEAAANLAGYEFDLLYDGNLVDLTGVTLTDALGQTTGCTPSAGRCAVPLGPLPQAANLGAAVSLGAYSYGAGAGLSGNATVATLHLSGRGVIGQTTLRILNPRFSDIDGVGSFPQGQDITLTLISPSAVTLRQSQTANGPLKWLLPALGVLLVGVSLTYAWLHRRARGSGLWLGLLALTLLGLRLARDGYAQTGPAATPEPRVYLKPNVSLQDSAEIPRLPQNAVGINPDVDNDTLVTVVDIQLVAAVFGQTPADPGWNPALDMNQDNLIDESDLTLVAGLWKLGLLSPRTSPTSGETGVAVTRETIIYFDRPINPASVTPASLFAQFGGETLATDLRLAPDGRRATLFYANPLSPNARVRVTLLGDAITDSLGYAIDPDGDGRAGGTFAFDFDTVNLTTLPGTMVCGRVFASELAPGEGGGSVNTPLEGATITVDGAEDTMHAATDSMGDFCLDPAPVGRFFVHIDGRTAVNNVPPGAYYPYVGKAWQSVAGQTVSVGDAFLPLVAPGTLQPVSQTEETVITFPPEVIAGHPELEGVQISVPADSLYGDDGTRGGQVGIAPVPPDRLPGRLPEGLDFPIVITVQTDGPTNFDVPAPICFPNLPDPNTGETQQPGEKSALWSFNHDDGKWHVVGPMTVSADRALVCSDPGYGILAPGWHGDDPDSEGDFGDGGGGDPDCDPEQEECDTPPPCPSPDDFRKYQFACSVGAGLGVAGCFTFNQGVEDLCGNIVSEHLCDEIVEGADDCAEKTAQLGKACQKRLDQCIADFISGRSILDVPDGPMSVLTDTVVVPYGTWPTDLLDELNELVLTSQSVVTDTLQQVALQDQIRAVLNGAVSDEELTPEQWAAFLPLLEQFNALTGGRGPQEFYNPRMDHLAQLVKVIEARLHLLDTPPGWYVLENLDNGLIQRGRTETNGALRGLFLSPETHYVLNRLVPQGSGFNFPQNQGGFGLTRSEFYSPPAGFRLDMRRGGWTYDPTPDNDGDGLTAQEEFVVGTSDNSADSDADGITDPTELLQATDPLDNSPAQTGLVGSVDTPGTAVDVCAFNDIVVVADSSAGVSVFNAFDHFNPIVIAQVNTPGAASRVACAPGQNRVAVADGSAGLAIIDIIDPPTATIVHQVALGGAAQAVAAEANLAYVGLSNGGIKVVDLQTGDVLGSVTVPGGVKDIQIGRNYIYALSATQLHVVSRFNQGLQRLTSTASPYIVPENRRLFAGESLVYAIHPRGYNTFDLSDPLHPTLIAAGNTAQFGWLQLVDNGSGLGVAAVGLNLNPDNTGDVRLYDVSDPGQTNEFLTTYETPGSARAVALYDGLAYAVDGARGLQVINYLAFDAQGQPPSVTLTTNFPAGLVEEGQVLQLAASVADDVQVGRVEFYVDSQRVSTDGNYPFTYGLIAPNTQLTLTVQARAFDTGGNAAWSDRLTLTVVPDATPPLVTQFTPQGGQAVNTVSAVSAFFSEPMSAAGLDTTTFLVREAGADGQLGTGDDVSVSADSLAYLDNNTAAALLFNTPLPIGRYQATLLGSITDLAGNPIGSDFSWEFNVRLGIYWTNPAGGPWSTAANWSGGSVPTGDDVVVIDLPAVYTVSVQGTQAAGSLRIVNPNATLKVQSTSAGNTTLTVFNDLINDGSVQIETTGANVNRPTLLEVTNGRFVNNGALEFLTGSNLNSRILRANLFNTGVVNVNYNATLDKANAEIVNEGVINIVSGETMTLSGVGHTFYQNAGLLSGGAFTSVNGGAFYFAGGAVTGLTPIINGGHLEFGPSAAGLANFRQVGVGTLRGDIPADVEVWINGGSGFGAAAVAAQQSFTNYGTLRLETGGANQNVASTLTLDNGLLTNRGVINSNSGSNLNARNLNASLDNQGVVNVNYNLTMAKANAVITSTGVINLAAGETLAISGGAPTVNLVSGDIAGSGIFKLTSGVVNFSAQTANATSPRLINSTLNFAPGAVGAGTWRMGGSDGHLSGDIPAGVTLWVNGGDLNNSAAGVTADAGLTNFGTIRIETSGANQNVASTLTVNNGVLVNQGTINANVGSNLNTRNLNASVDNRGAINVNYNLNMALAGAAITNRGSIVIAADETLSISNAMPTFTLDGGAIGGGGVFKLTSGQFNYLSGDVSGGDRRLFGSTLSFGPGATGAGTLRMADIGGALSGDIPPNVTLWVNGGDLANGAATVVAENGLTNYGTIRLETSGANQNWPSTLTVNSGTLVNVGVINSNAGSNLNTRNLNASLDNQGTVNVNYNLNMGKADAIITSTGTINIVSGETLAISGGAPTVNLVGGSIAGSGVFKLTGGVVNFSGQTANDTSPRLINSTLNFAPGAVGTGTWRMGGTNGHLSGDIPAGVTLWVNGGDLNNSAAGVTADAGLTNFGVIRIETSGANQNVASTLTVNNGVLVNQGSINANVGSNLNTRNLNASLDNQGVVNVNYSLTMAKANAVITSTGVINLAAGETLAISGGAPTVNLVGGGITGSGVFKLTGGVVNFSAQTANDTSPRLINSTLNFAPGAVGTGTWRMGGTNGHLSGDIPAGVTLWVNGGDLNNSAAGVTADAGLTNFGVIRIETSGANQNVASTLTINNGVLVNQGTINANVGSNLNTRNLNAALDNQGAVNVNYNLTLNKSGAAYANGGVMTIAGGETLRFMGGGTFTNATGGSIQGAGVLRVDEVTATNSGMVNPGLSPGVLTVTGIWPHTAQSELNIEIGGLGVGSGYDRLAVSAAAMLDGTLNLSLINGFDPAIGATFQIMTFSSRTGTFATVNGLPIGNGKQFQVVYNATNVTLQVVAAP